MASGKRRNRVAFAGAIPILNYVGTGKRDISPDSTRAARRQAGRRRRFSRDCWNAIARQRALLPADIPRVRPTLAMRDAHGDASGPLAKALDLIAGDR
jgi:hypothetical protein